MWQGNLLLWQPFCVHVRIQSASSGQYGNSLYFPRNKKTLGCWAFLLLVCMLMGPREENTPDKRRGGEHTSIRVTLCVWCVVCVCLGHSTVLYIKLSAPRLSSSSKWSLMARGGFVSQLWIKGRECPKPQVTASVNHQIQRKKDRCGVFVCSWVHVCLCTVFVLCVCFYAHCMHHLQSCSLCEEYDAQPVSEPWVGG